jgi:hypothetical protein
LFVLLDSRLRGNDGTLGAVQICADCLIFMLRRQQFLFPPRKSFPLYRLLLLCFRRVAQFLLNISCHELMCLNNMKRDASKRRIERLTKWGIN